MLTIPAAKGEQTTFVLTVTVEAPTEQHNIYFPAANFGSLHTGDEQIELYLICGKNTGDEQIELYLIPGDA
jgi:hypothetical protein